MGYEDNPSRLLAHYLYDDPLIALPVKFGVEDLLPCAEVEFPIRHGHDDFMMDEQRFQMRISVVFASLVMLVVLPKRSQRLQPLVDVLDQPTLVIVDVHASRNVHG